MLSRIALPSQEFLLENLQYFPETGEVICKKKWCSKVVVGKPVGYGVTKGYVGMSIAHGKYLMHRIIYRMVTGIDLGQSEIDHANGVPNDNRWENLREATHDQNNQNVAIQKNNTSGFKGVSWHKQRNCWRGYVSVGPRDASKQISAGLHRTPEAAAAAVSALREKLHGEFTHHG